MARKKQTADDASRLLRIRELVVLAVASDDVLMERLVLKGGTALDLVHLPGVRASVDVDFSMAGDFASDGERADVSVASCVRWSSGSTSTTWKSST